MWLGQPDTTLDCHHGCYAATCPDCTGVTVEGSRVVLAIALALIALDVLVLALDIEADQAAAVTCQFVARLGAAW